MGNPPDKEDETVMSNAEDDNAKGDNAEDDNAEDDNAESTLVTNTNDKQKRDDESTSGGSEYNKKVKVAVAGLNQAHRERKAAFDRIENKKELAKFKNSTQYE